MAGRRQQRWWWWPWRSPKDGNISGAGGQEEEIRAGTLVTGRAGGGVQCGTSIVRYRGFRAPAVRGRGVLRSALHQRRPAAQPFGHRVETVSGARDEWLVDRCARRGRASQP